jgi:hypothetical protein
MPRTREQNKRILEQRKNEIIESAITIFTVKDYKDVTIDDITNKLNISHGLFYHYFKSKKEVFDHMLAMRRRDAHKELVFEIEKAPTYRQKLRVILDNMFGDLTNDENFAYFYFFFVSQSFALKEKGVPPPKNPDPDAKPPIFIMEDFFKKGQEVGEIYDKYSPKDCARMFISIVQGATLGYVIAPKEIQKKMKLPNTDFILDVFCKES